LSHDKAKRYYDKGTRDIHLKKGDVVYLHNPIAKRSRAKKFAYQYQGPYTILERVSPLVYKLQTDADRSIIAHVNRLNLAHPSLPGVKGTSKDTSSKTPGRNVAVRTDKLNRETPDDDVLRDEADIPMTRQLIDKDEQSENENGSESSEISPTREDRQNPAWAPETEYLRRKLLPRNEVPVERVPTTPYALRPRLARTQDNATEQVEPRNEQLPSSLSGEAPAGVRREQSDTGSHTPTTHSYELRS
jgi:hypothetical protein